MVRGEVASFDNLHTVRREAFRARITRLNAGRMEEACATLRRALGCV